MPKPQPAPSLGEDSVFGDGSNDIRRQESLLKTGDLQNAIFNRIF
jgi:hypothetical protein